MADARKPNILFIMSDDKWFVDRAFAMVPAQIVVAKWLESFKEFPPRAKSASFSIDQVVERLLPRT